jgi:CheY-like chemotaxis protein
LRRRVLEAGASGYLKKPFDDNSLVQCLEKALRPRGVA